MTTAQIVPPGNIQTALDDLWNAKANKNKVRASLFNLIFCVTKSPREEYVRKIAFKLVEKFPSRVFFVSLDASSTEPLQTSVSVISTKQGEFDITCDFIEISAGQKDEHIIPFILLPNIVPDLPVFLLWSEDPCLKSPLADALERFATRVIFDSESAENLELFAQTVLDKKKKFATSNHTEIADLNWARLESWRSLISSTFANEDMLKKFQQVTSVIITYNGQETPSFCHTRIQSTYLQAWLASCLGWKKINASKYKNKELEISMQLQEIKDVKLAPGMIVSMSIETSEKETFFFFRKEGVSDEILFEHSSQVECSVPVRIHISKGESGQSLVQEICQKGTSQHYIQTLEVITNKGT